MKEFEDYKKYKWFYTSSDKLVIGGKNAVQNDSFLQKIKSLKKDFIVLHTEAPGSPFSIIISDINKIDKNDVEESAVFTACFSQAWKKGSKKVYVHFFNSNQIYKTKGMKSGTWGVIGNVKKISVELSLVLIKQQGILRAVPEKSVKNKKNIFGIIYPGKIPKEELAPKILNELNGLFTQYEIMSAIPSGGLRFCKK
ncbi:MAG: NFACT RNA binding domain-containing protein [Nanoarchaeota archaeon]